MLSKLVPTALIASQAVTALNCPTCWQDDGTGQACIPDPNKIKLHCMGYGMEFEVDKCVFDGAEKSDLALNDPPTSDACIPADSLNIMEAGDRWLIISDMVCSTLEAETLSDEESVLRFSNRITWNGDDQAHELISFGSSLYLDFTCTYNANYEVGDEYTVESSVTGGTAEDIGNFEFSLEQYADATFSEIRDPQEGAHRMGHTMYFGVKINTFVDAVEFSTMECSVTSKVDSTKSLTILENGQAMCENYVELNVVENPSKTLNKFSFTVFEFRGVELGQGMNLNCKVKVCDANETDNVCQNVSNSNAVDSCSNGESTGDEDEEDTDPRYHADEDSECVKSDNFSEIYITLPKKNRFGGNEDDIKVNFVNMHPYAHGDLHVSDNNQDVTEPNFLLQGVRQDNKLYYRISPSSDTSKFLGFKDFSDPNDYYGQHGKPIIFEEDLEGDNLWNIKRKSGTLYYNLEYKSQPGMCLSQSIQAVYLYLIPCDQDDSGITGNPADTLRTFMIGNKGQNQIVSDCFS